MNMKTTVTITKYPETFGRMENFKPAGYGTTVLPEGAPTFDNGVPMQDPETQKDRDLWQRMYLGLHDVPMPKPEDWGKALILVNEPGGQYNIQYTFPTQILNPRNFSIAGDGTAPEVSFNGTQNVVLQLRNLVAESWKTARTITITGADASGNVTLDGSQNVNLPVTVIQAPKWTTSRTFQISGNATGSVQLDGTQNVNLNLTVNQSANATNATNATNAITADKVKAGGLTITLTGGATGSGTSDVNGNVTINTTVSGGSSSGGSGSADLGKNTQQWGEVTTDSAGNATITFAKPYISSSSYTIVFNMEITSYVSGAGNAPAYLVTGRGAGSVSIRVVKYDSGDPYMSTRINYIVVGQTTP